MNSIKVLPLLLLTFALSLPVGSSAQQTASAMGQTVQTVQGTWHGNFTGQGVGETVTLKDGVLYFSDEHTAPMVIGDIRGFVVGKGGFYALNLDGNAANQLNFAFYEPTQDRWMRGVLNGNHVLTWTPVANHMGRYTALQVGSGATMFPLEQVTEAAQRGAGAQAAAGAIATAPLNYPVEGVQYTALAPSQHVWTHFLITADGNVAASTRVKEDTLLGGYHARVTIGFYTSGSPDLYLESVSSPSIGVTGTMFGHSDVTVSWNGHVAPTELPRFHDYAVIQLHEPDWFTTVNDASKFADLAAKVITILKSL